MKKLTDKLVPALALLFAAVLTICVLTAATPSNIPISGMNITTQAVEGAYFPLIQPWPGRPTNDNWRIAKSNLFYGIGTITVTNLYATNFYVTNIYASITNIYFTNLFVTNLYVSNIISSDLLWTNDASFGGFGRVTIKPEITYEYLYPSNTIFAGWVSYVPQFKLMAAGSNNIPCNMYSSFLIVGADPDPSVAKLYLQSGAVFGQDLLLFSYTNTPFNGKFTLPADSAVVGGIGNVKLANGQDWVGENGAVLRLFWADPDWWEVGRWYAGGTNQPTTVIMNPTNGRVPYRVDEDEFGDSAWHYLADTNSMGFNSSNRFIYSSASSIGLGPLALNSSTGDKNIAIGAGAGYSNTIGIRNTFVGDDAGRGSTTGNQNVGMGYRALYYMAAGQTRNTALGASALSGNSGTGGANDNTAVGFSAGLASTGIRNTFIGSLAGEQATTGVNNTAIGYNAMGDGVLINATFGNVAVGHYAGAKIGSGNNNIAIGDASMSASASSVTGNNNIGISYHALNALTSGDGNIALGSSALLALNTGQANIAIGGAAGQAITSGTYNILLGDNSGTALTTGTMNIVGGYLAGQSISSGGYNTVLGSSAFANNGAGSGASEQTVAIGFNALANNTNSYNTAVGANSLANTTNSTENVAVGILAGQAGDSSFNTYLGAEAGQFVVKSDGYNTQVGYRSGYYQTNGALNTFVGALTGLQASDTVERTNQVAIGFNVSPTNSNEIVIGNASNTRIFMPMPVIPTHTPANSSETNYVGAVTWDASYIYIWTSANVNKRVALSAW